MIMRSVQYGLQGLAAEPPDDAFKCAGRPSFFWILGCTVSSSSLDIFKLVCSCDEWVHVSRLSLQLRLLGRPKGSGCLDAGIMEALRDPERAGQSLQQGRCLTPFSVPLDRVPADAAANHHGHVGLLASTLMHGLPELSAPCRSQPNKAAFIETASSMVYKT